MEEANSNYLGSKQVRISKAYLNKKGQLNFFSHSWAPDVLKTPIH
jgi:hypothetical protein